MIWQWHFSITTCDGLLLDLTLYHCLSLPEQWMLFDKWWPKFRMSIQFLQHCSGLAGPVSCQVWPLPVLYMNLYLRYSPAMLIQERLKRQNTLGCLDQYVAQNSKYASTPIPSQPPTQKVFFQWHTQYDPTMKHSHCETVYAKPRSCSNGCSLNWFPPPPPPPPPPHTHTEFFQFSQLSN